MSNIFKGNWICNKDFESLEPINVFHKEKEAFIIPEKAKEIKNLHLLFRKKFELEKSDKAYIRISADDYYKLYINGRFVSQGPAPGYHYNYYYNEVDVSEFLVDGDNIICVHVYYQGLINRVWNSGDLRCGLIADLFVDDKCICMTDNSWKQTKLMAYSISNTVGYETQFLENYDSEREHKGWLNPEFDDSLWDNALVKRFIDYIFFKDPVKVLSVYSKKPARTLYQDAKRMLYDFGQEITGTLSISAIGKKGQLITILSGEELQDGDISSVRYKMRCNCEYKELWTLAEGNNTLEQYDYKAFRYVELVSEDNLSITNFEAIVRHYSFNDNDSYFGSSNDRLNSIWNLLKNSIKYGCQEVYVDCPTREKGQYLGDLTITSHAQLYLTGDLSLFRKALIDFSCSSKICQGMMAVAPGSFMQEIADYSLQYPLLLLRYYEHSGDINLLRELFPVASNIIKYFKQFSRPDGLIENVKAKTNLVDWPSNLRDDYEYGINEYGCHNVLNAFYCLAIKNLEEIMDILEIKYESHYLSVKKSFNKAFYDDGTKLFVDHIGSKHSSLHSNTISVFAGLHDEKNNSEISRFIENKGFSCGVYMAYFVLKALAQLKRYDLVYSFILKDDRNSWYNMVREGATTCFEAWGKDLKWNTSLCHPWACGAIPVLIEEIVGIKPAKPGWEDVYFTPHIPDELDELTLEFKANNRIITVKKETGSEANIKIYPA